MADRSHLAPSRAMLRRMLPSLVLNGAVPLLAYTLVRPEVGNDAAALAIGGAIPVVVTAAGFVRRRRIDAFGVVAVAGFAIALAVTALTGGNSFVLKLHDSIITGPLGVVFLASLATRRPLLLLVATQLAERRQDATAAPLNSRALYVLTGLVGTLMVVHATVILLLALALPTSSFLAVGRPVGWAVTAAGIAGLLWYRNRLRTGAA